VARVPPTIAPEVKSATIPASPLSATKTAPGATVIVAGIVPLRSVPLMVSGKGVATLYNESAI
jgi:hypothetical protein